MNPIGVDPIPLEPSRAVAALESGETRLSFSYRQQ